MMVSRNVPTMGKICYFKDIYKTSSRSENLKLGVVIASTISLAIAIATCLEEFRFLVPFLQRVHTKSIGIPYLFE